MNKRQIIQKIMEGLDFNSSEIFSILKKTISKSDLTSYREIAANRLDICAERKIMDPAYIKAVCDKYRLKFKIPNDYLFLLKFLMKCYTVFGPVLDLNWIDISNLTNATGLFWDVPATHLDIHTWNFTSCQVTCGLFNHMERLEYLDISECDFSNVDDNSYMFLPHCYIKTIKFPPYHLWDINAKYTSYMADVYKESTGKEPLMEGLDFTDDNLEIKKTISNKNFNSYKDIAYNQLEKFAEDESLKVRTIKKICDTYHIKYKVPNKIWYILKLMVACGKAFKPDLDLNWIDISNVTSMYAAFMFIKNIRSLDIHTWDFSKCSEASHMFDHMANLEYLDISECDFSNLKHNTKMFYKVPRTLKVKFPPKEFWDSNVITINGSEISDLSFKLSQYARNN